MLTCALVVPAVAGADNAKPAPKSDITKAKLGETETRILAHLHHINQMEIKLGKLAQASGTAPVKKYGQQLVTDHTTADKDLAAFAKKRGLNTLPAEKADTDTAKTEMKKMMDEMAGLKKLKGADFDREYLRMMVEGHDKELAGTAGHQEASQDDELDTLLENRKTSLQRHSDTAKELQRGNAQATK